MRGLISALLLASDSSDSTEGLDTALYEILLRPSKRERRFGSGAKLTLALLRGRRRCGPLARKVTWAGERLDAREARCAEWGERMAEEERREERHAARMQQLTSHLSSEARAVMTMLGIGAPVRQDDSYLLHAERQRQRALIEYNRAVDRAEEAFVPYRDAILDAVLHWSRSRPPSSTVGPQRRQPVRATRVGPCARILLIHR